MKKKFKTKKKRNYRGAKIISILLIVYISFHLFYNLIYNIYLSKLTNEEIITHIIANTKNEKKSNRLLSKYKNPETILKEEFTYTPKTEEVIQNLSEEIEVYIYCTHETEAYADEYLEIYNIKPTVKTMSYILQDYLIDLGINTKVEEGSVTKILKENDWAYNRSYDASKSLITPTIEATPSLKLIIDLHRDSSPLSKTLLTVNETNYARILFVVGAEHENYEENYKLAQMLNENLNAEIDGITRGITKKSGAGVNGIYNQNLSPKCVLIELGGQYNEIEELNNSLKVLAKAILKYIEGA